MPVLNPTLKLTTSFQRFTASKTFNCIVLSLIFFNAFLMFVKIILDWKYPRTMLDYPSTLHALDIVFWAITLTFLSLFTLEITARFLALGPLYFSKWIHVLDLLVTVVPIVLMAYNYPSNLVNATHLGQFIILIRVWRIVPVVLLFHKRAQQDSIDDEAKRQGLIHQLQKTGSFQELQKPVYTTGMSQRRQQRG